MKKFLLSLFVGFLGIISFCSAYDLYNIGYETIAVAGVSNRNFDNGTCLRGTNMENFWIFANDDTYVGIISSNSNNLVCFNFSGYLKNRGSTNINVLVYSGVYNYLSSGGGSCPECPTCPEINTGEILSGYILESEIDTNYCVGNGLCPNECGSGTDMSGDLQYSNLYINNILHPGTENIFLNIQDNIFWDYSQSESGLIVDVGSGYDQDYIDGVINVQSYRPTSEDFTQTFVGGLILFTPYVVILLFVILVWNLIKKIFKTK